ncbi:MAG: type II secretion system protein [Akkermansiaceae bacterium]|jgi:type II secretory pathway pseudopilin PulG
MHKISKKSRQAKGFTLAELLVAMTITIVLVTLTVIITGSAIDAWKGARSEVRAAGQAKAMLNALGRDLEALVSRTGTDSEWLYASAQDEMIGPDGESSPNAARMYFFTAASDRYDGNAGDLTKDEGGDISAVGYELDYLDPVFGDDSEEFSTFVLYRKLLDPDETFNGKLIGTSELKQDFAVQAGVNELEDFICENVYEFTVVFVIEYKDTNREVKTVKVPVLADPGAKDVVKSFKVTGAGLEPNENPNSEYRGGRIVSIELSITVLSDEGIRILRKSPFRSDDVKNKFIEKNGYRYTRSIAIPQ